MVCQCEVLMSNLRGAEFPWFFNMFPMWLTTGVLLLGIYFLVDLFFYRHERQTVIDADEDHVTPIRIHGKVNFLYLILIVFTRASRLSPQYRGTSEAEGVLLRYFIPPPPLRGERPSALLCADKPAVVATDAIIPH